MTFKKTIETSLGKIEAKYQIMGTWVKLNLSLPANVLLYEHHIRIVQSGESMISINPTPIKTEIELATRKALDGQIICLVPSNKPVKGERVWVGVSGNLTSLVRPMPSEIGSQELEAYQQNWLNKNGFEIIEW